MVTSEIGGKGVCYRRSLSNPRSWLGLYYTYVGSGKITKFLGGESISQSSCTIPSISSPTPGQQARSTNYAGLQSSTASSGAALDLTAGAEAGHGRNSRILAVRPRGCRTTAPLSTEHKTQWPSNSMCANKGGYPRSAPGQPQQSLVG